MSFYDGLKPNASMIQTVRDAEKKQAEIQGLVKRFEKQRETVTKLSETIEDMVTHQPWNKCLKPEDALKSKRKLMDAKNQFVEEEEMLEAVQLALTNTRKDAQHVLSGADTVITGAFRAAAVNKEAEILANLNKAMDDFFMSKLAVDPGGFSGAIYALETAAQNTQRHIAVSKQFGEAVKKLREQTYAATRKKAA